MTERAEAVPCPACNVPGSWFAYAPCPICVSVGGVYRGVPQVFAAIWALSSEEVLIDLMSDIYWVGCVCPQMNGCKVCRFTGSVPNIGRDEIWRRLGGDAG